MQKMNFIHRNHQEISKSLRSTVIFFPARGWFPSNVTLEPDTLAIETIILLPSIRFIDNQSVYVGRSFKVLAPVIAFQDIRNELSVFQIPPTKFCMNSGMAGWFQKIDSNPLQSMLPRSQWRGLQERDHMPF